jgi:hypothetical protein
LTASLNLDADRLDDWPPFLDFRLLMCAERFRSLPLAWRNLYCQRRKRMALNCKRAMPADGMTAIRSSAKDFGALRLKGSLRKIRATLLVVKWVS